MAKKFVGFEVQGMAELRAALGASGPKLPRLVATANKRAAERVAAVARASYGRLHPPRTGRGARSIRAQATTRLAIVAMGGARTPYMVGQEYGSIRHRRFPPHSTDGYFLNPAVRKELPGLREDYLGILEDVIAEAARG